MTERSPRLAGLRVLDLGRVYLGPWAGALLAHAGAEVSKVEEPTGEPARRGGRDAVTLPLAMLNTAKQAITLDLEHPRGRELLLALGRLAQCDHAHPAGLTFRDPTAHAVAARRDAADRGRSLLHRTSARPLQ